MIRNLLFDFSGVLMNLNIERDTHSLLAAGLPDWKGCMSDTALRSVLLAYLNGLMPWEEFLLAVKPFCKVDVTEKEIYDAMNDVLDEVPKARVEWILSLKNRYRIYLLSNICKESWAICQQHFEETGHKLEDCFDQVFLSYEMQLAKPDAQIFLKVQEETGLVPEETLFLDDTLENIEAAEQLGFKGLHVKMNQLENYMEKVDNKRQVMETDRILLRRWQESDAKALYKYASDPDVGPRAGWPVHQSVEESLEVIRNIFTNDTTWAIVLKETGEAIGCMGYFTSDTSNIPIGVNDCEVGYWVGKPYWNQGICTEALELMLEYCLSYMHFENIWSDHFIGNPASGRVMEKCGFRDTGKLNRCSHLYGGDKDKVRIYKLYQE